jgi:hypothetical protein
MSWFWYATQNLPIGIGGPAQEPQVQIDARSDFLALILTGWSDQEDVAVPVNHYSFEISNSSSGRAFQSQPLISRAVVGTGQRPYYLAVPILFEASSSIALRIIALNPAVAYNIRIVIGGVKIYRE